MLNNIEYESSESSIAEVLGVKIDRILVFVETKAEIEAFRRSNFYYFEFINRNLEQGTISNIFFLKNLALELVWIENRELAVRYSSRTNMNIVARTRWQQNQAIPFGFVLRYVSSHQSRSRRRCYNSERKKVCNNPIHSQISFSHKNLQELKEPVCFIVPKLLTCESLLDNTSAIKRRLLFCQSKISKLTNITLTLDTSKPLTSTIALLSTLDSVNIERGYHPKLKLEFDNGCRRQSLSIFSKIPIILSY